MGRPHFSKIERTQSGSTSIGVVLYNPGTERGAIFAIVKRGQTLSGRIECLTWDGAMRGDVKTLKYTPSREEYTAFKKAWEKAEGKYGRVEIPLPLNGLQQLDPKEIWKES